MSETTDDISGLNFEDALKRLEDIVRKLESGDVPLDQSIDLYSQGEQLRNLCQKRLEDAQASRKARHRSTRTEQWRRTAIWTSWPRWKASLLM